MVFVHKTGIYVIESKNYGGYVVGSSEDIHWYQRFKNDRRKQFKFYNPIFQNNGHVKRLSKVLGKDIDKYFVPIVVFGNRCDIRKLRIDREYTVIGVNKLIEVVEKEIVTRKTVLNEKEVTWVSNKLKTYTNASDELKKEHAINANKTKKYAEKNL